jgi:hypothetical protein
MHLSHISFRLQIYYTRLNPRSVGQAETADRTVLLAQATLPSLNDVNLLASDQGGQALVVPNDEWFKPISSNEAVYAVVEIMKIERVKRAANMVSGLLKDSVDLLSRVVTKLSDKDHAAAERGLQQVRDQFARSEIPFQDLGRRQASGQLSAQLTAQYGRIYQAAKKSRELQSQVISLAETVLSQAKASNGDTPDAWRDKYEEIRAAYDQSDDELQALLAQLDAMARPR